MGLFTPKYPTGAEPPAKPRKPSRREIRETTNEAARYARDSLTGDELRRTQSGPHTRVEVNAAYAEIITDHPHYHGRERVNRRPDGTFPRPKNGDGFSRRYR